MRKRTGETERYFWISLALTLLSNMLSFQCSRLFNRHWLHHSVALPLDGVIPFLPWTITVYLGCIVYWFFLYRLAARLPRERADRFFCANVLGKAVALVVFLAYPTAMVRPEVTGTGVWNALVRFLYWIDSPDNLFPSIHCFLGWLGWAGIRGNRDVPFAWRFSALAVAVLVCFSTLTTKQHLLPDVFAGVLLAEISFALAGLPGVLGRYGRFVDRIIRRVKRPAE